MDLPRVRIANLVLVTVTAMSACTGSHAGSSSTPPDTGLAPCAWVAGAPDSPPGAQGERRIPVPPSATEIVAAGDATDIAWSDGTNIVQRRLATGEERTLAVDGTPTALSRLSRDRVAALIYPASGGTGQYPLGVVDLGACATRLTDVVSDQQGTPSQWSTASALGLDGERLVSERRSYRVDGSSGAPLVSFGVLDLATGSHWSLGGEFGFEAGPAAVGADVLAWFERSLDGTSVLRWQRLDGSDAGSTPSSSCYGLAVSGGSIAWTEKRSSHESCVLRTVTIDGGAPRDVPLPPGRFIGSRMSLLGSLLVYEGNGGLYALDLATGVERPVFVGPVRQLVGLLPGGVVWTAIVDEGVRGVFWSPSVHP